MTILKEDCPDAAITCISLQLERLGKIGQGQNWSFSESLLQSVKGDNMVDSPNKEHTLLEQISQRSGNHSIVLNELPIIPCESEEAAKLLDIRWLRLGLHSGNL